MSTSAIFSALSGLKATQAGIDVVAGNVANAGTAGYTRKSQANVAQVIAGQTAGVRAGEVTRVLDTLLQRQSWTEAAGGSYTSTASSYASRLDALFGTPGGTDALDTTYNAFTASMQALATKPDDAGTQGAAVGAAQALAQRINGIAGSIQGMRADTEGALSSAVDQVNADLKNISALSDKIVSTSQGGVPSAALLDQRDAAISDLASLIDIKVVPGENSKLSVFTGAGALLFDGQAAQLTFDSHGVLSADTSYSTDPTKRGTGTITLLAPNGSSVDMIGSGLIRSGTIGALVNLRDSVLPTAQAQLDTVAAGLSQSLSDRTVAGTAVSGGMALDLTGLQTGNPIAVTVGSGATAKSYQFVETKGGATLPAGTYGGPGVTVVGYSGGTAGAVAAMNATLGAGYTASASGSTLTLVAGAGGTVGALSATVTATGASGGTPQLPLFVDANSTPYTAAYDGKAERTGYAARIGVNASLIADPSLLVKSSATTASGDTTRPDFIVSALGSAPVTAPPDTGFGTAATPFTGSVGDLVRQVVSSQAADAQTAKNLDAGQQVVVNTLADKMQATSGVNIDTEMANLLQLQNSYSANARVLSTVKEMLQALMSM